MKTVLMVLLVTIVTIQVVASAGKTRKGGDKSKAGKSGPECAEWRYGNCVPTNGDCGAGFRDGTCEALTRKMKCKVPCNWKKNFGADCKYRFETWGECDTATGLRGRTGTLKKALYNAECQPTINVTKPCAGKTKTKTKGKKGKAKESN